MKTGPASDLPAGGWGLGVGGWVLGSGNKKKKKIGEKNAKCQLYKFSNTHLLQKTGDGKAFRDDP